jgi:hypothetical protein
MLGRIGNSWWGRAEAWRRWRRGPDLHTGEIPGGQTWLLLWTWRLSKDVTAVTGVLFDNASFFGRRSPLLLHPKIDGVARDAHPLSLLFEFFQKRGPYKVGDANKFMPRCALNFEKHGVRYAGLDLRFHFCLAPVWVFHPPHM